MYLFFALSELSFVHLAAAILFFLKLQIIYLHMEINIKLLINISDMCDSILLFFSRIIIIH